MAESLVESVDALHAALVSFQPEAYSGEDCATLVEKLAAVEKVSAAARVRAAAQAGECGAHRERGFANVSDWMARATGSTAGSAKAALDTSAALESQPEAKAALEAGELSFAQARELVKTEAAVPGSTAGLLDVAKGQSLRTLREQARDRRLRAIDPEELHVLQHAAMYHRHWTTALGTIAYAGELPPEIGIPFTNILDAETDRLWLKAHEDANRHNAAGQQNLGGAATDSVGDIGDAGAAGSGAAGSRAAGSGIGDSGGAKVEVRRSALAAQAFVRMMENGGGIGKANRADLVIVCDLRAYRRGHAHEGEPCHIVGGGPIPVSLARELGRDSFLKAVLHTGTEIHTIAHFGRKYPAVLRTALDLGAPPDFNGNVCAAPGCDRCYHLQRDHIDPVANGGLTSYVNNQPLCPPDHRIKTERDRKAGLLRRKELRSRRPDATRAGLSREHSQPRLQ
ncbi:MAG TPA: HNH endonuclease signature motif containing protein [Acidimicrobiia bacterium]|nr:HNH endonuclease signature motif containing protein [Acidimicrobiia bacterium]